MFYLFFLPWTCCCRSGNTDFLPGSPLLDAIDEVAYTATDQFVVAIGATFHVLYKASPLQNGEVF